MGNIENIKVKGAEFSFGGKQMKLSFVMSAIDYLKDKHGGYMMAIRKMDDHNQEIDTAVFCDVLYAGFMCMKDETVTKEWIRETVNDMTLFDVKEIATTHLVAALTQSYPDAKVRDSGTPQ